MQWFQCIQPFNNCDKVPVSRLIDQGGFSNQLLEKKINAEDPPLLRLNPKNVSGEAMLDGVGHSSDDGGVVVGF